MGGLNHPGSPLAAHNLGRQSEPQILRLGQQGDLAFDYGRKREEQMIVRRQGIWSAFDDKLATNPGGRISFPLRLEKNGRWLIFQIDAAAENLLIVGFEKELGRFGRAEMREVRGE